MLSAHIASEVVIMKPGTVLAVLLAIAAGVGGGILLERQVLSAQVASQAGTGPRILYWWDPMIPDYKVSVTSAHGLGDLTFSALICDAVEGSGCGSPGPRRRQLQWRSRAKGRYGMPHRKSVRTGRDPVAGDPSPSSSFGDRVRSRR